MDIETDIDRRCMARAYELAKQAEDEGEVPVGAVLMKDNEIISETFNQPISRSDPTAHAEILALRDAAKKIGNYRLIDTTLYVTLEPCPMCAGAIIHARVKRVVFACHDPKSGAAGSVYNILNDNSLNHTVQLSQGLMQEEASLLLKNFFRKRR